MAEDELIRHVQVTGGNSFIITLPKQWCLEENIKRNDELKFIRLRNGLLLTRGISTDTSNFEIYLDKLEFPDDDEYLKKIIVAGYIAGYKTISLKTNYPRIKPAFRAVARWFIRQTKGLVVQLEEDQKIVIEDPINLQTPVENTINSMRVVIKGMLLDECEALRTKDIRLLEGEEGVINRDDELDRNHWFVHRQTSQILFNIIPAQKLEFAPSLMMQNYFVSRSLERVGDHIVKMSSQSKQVIEIIKEEPHDEILEALVNVIETARKLLDMGIDAYLKKNPQDALVLTHKVSHDLPNLDKSCNDLIERAHHEPTNIAVPVSLIVENIRSIGESSSDISIATINKIIKREMETGQRKTGYDITLHEQKIKTPRIYKKNR